jgi:hypothetical protein
VGPRTGLDIAVAKRKRFCTCQESNRGRPGRSLLSTLKELTLLVKVNKTKQNIIYNFLFKDDSSVHASICKREDLGKKQMRISPELLAGKKSHSELRVNRKRRPWVCRWNRRNDSILRTDIESLTSADYVNSSRNTENTGAQIRCPILIKSIQNFADKNR